MLKKADIRSTVISGIIAALLFGIAVYFYIRSANYEQTWLLYMGSFAFMVVMWVHIIRDSQKRGYRESTVALVFNSHVAALTGIVFSVLISLLELTLFVPGYFNGEPTKALANAPANTVRDNNTNGLAFKIFMVATIVNFSVGSFAGIILPFYLKRNQTKDPKNPTPLQQTVPR